MCIHTYIYSIWYAVRHNDATKMLTKCRFLRWYSLSRSVCIYTHVSMYWPLLTIGSLKLWAKCLRSQKLTLFCQVTFVGDSRLLLDQAWQFTRETRHSSQTPLVWSVRVCQLLFGKWRIVGCSASSWRAVLVQATQTWWKIAVCTRPGSVQHQPKQFTIDITHRKKRKIPATHGSLPPCQLCRLIRLIQVKNKSVPATSCTLPQTCMWDCRNCMAVQLDSER